MAGSPGEPGARGASEPVLHRYRSGFHDHAEGQLIWFSGSVQQLRTMNAIWVTPGGGAVWIPPRYPHCSVIHGDGVEHYLHLDAALCAGLPARCCLVRVSPELSAAAAPILAAGGSAVSGPHVGALCREIRATPVRPLASPLPATLARLKPIAELLEEHPLDPRSLEDWASFFAMSARSLQRIVRREVARSFPIWRLQFRMLWALERLAAGTPVAELSAALGYRRSDSFAGAFRRMLGAAPADYFAPLERSQPGWSAVASVTPARIQCTVRHAPPGAGRGNESHPEAELVWSESSVRSVTTPGGTWVLPVAHGIWIPPHRRHVSRHWSETTMQRVRIEGCAQLPDRCCAVIVSSALRDAFHTIRAKKADSVWDESSWDATAGTLLDQIRDSGLRPIPLPLPPLEGPLVPLLTALQADPTSKLSLVAWASYLGMSVRTLKRTFMRDTGITFSRWRLLSRFRYALECLAAGRDVSHATRDAGYASVSTFVATFRRLLGTTPGQYFGAPCAIPELSDGSGAISRALRTSPTTPTRPSR